MHNDANFYAKPSQLVYGMSLSAKWNVPDAVKDFIRKWGAPAVFLSNSTAKNKSGEIKDLKQHYNISGHYYSEPGYQNQN